MAAHRVPADAACCGGGKVLFDQLRQLVHDVVVHLVVRGPRLLGGIDVKPCTLAKVVALGVVGDMFAAWAGVGGHHDDAVLGGIALGLAFGDEVLFVAGQAREPVQHGACAVLCLRWQVDTQPHGAAEQRRGVRPHFLSSAKANVVLYALHGDGLKNG